VWEFEKKEEQENEGMSAEGFFSLTAAHSKGSQFICTLRRDSRKINS